MNRTELNNQSKEQEEQEDDLSTLPAGSTIIDSTSPDQVSIELPNNLKVALSSTQMKVRDLSGLALGLIQELNNTKEKKKEASSYHG